MLSFHEQFFLHNLKLLIVLAKSNLDELEFLADNWDGQVLKYLVMYCNTWLFQLVSITLNDKQTNRE